MLSTKESENINRSILICYISDGAVFFTSRKEFGITMEYQNNNRNYDKRNSRKAKKRKLLFYRVAGILLCLLIVAVILDRKSVV